MSDPICLKHQDGEHFYIVYSLDEKHVVRGLFSKPELADAFISKHHHEKLYRVMVFMDSPDYDIDYLNACRKKAGI